MNAAPILIHFILAGCGCALALRAQRWALALYLAAVPLIGIGGMFVLFNCSAEAYRLYFLLSDLAHNALLLVLAVEIISELSPRRWVTPWALFWIGLLIFGAVRQTSDLQNISLLNLTVASGFCACGILLLALLRSDTPWTRRNALVVAGVALVALGSIVPEIPLLLQQETIGRLMQWLDVPGLIFLTLATGWTATAARERQSEFMAAAAK